MNIGAAIKKLRKLRGISLQELANKVGLDKSSISNLESEKRSTSLRMLSLIANALDVELLLLIYVATLDENMDMPLSLREVLDEMLLNMIKS